MKEAERAAGNRSPDKPPASSDDRTKLGLEITQRRGTLPRQAINQPEVREALEAEETRIVAAIKSAKPGQVIVSEELRKLHAAKIARISRERNFNKWPVTNAFLLTSEERDELHRIVVRAKQETYELFGWSLPFSEGEVSQEDR